MFSILKRLYLASNTRLTHFHLRLKHRILDSVVYSNTFLINAPGAEAGAAPFERCAEAAGATAHRCGGPRELRTATGAGVRTQPGGGNKQPLGHAAAAQHGCGSRLHHHVRARVPHRPGRDSHHLHLTLGQRARSAGSDHLIEVI
jgi:hypothetical protein